MRKLLISLVMIILLSVYVSCVFAKEAMTDKDRAKLGLALSLSGLKKYDESVKILKDLRKRFPGDKMIDVELINSLYEAGMEKEAEKEVSGILKEKLHDTKSALRLVVILGDRERYQEAIKICDEALVEEPDNREVSLWLARLLSWDGQYKRSLQVYTEIINKNQDWLEPRIEKARVLGWDHRYSASIKEYEDAFRQVKTSDETVRLEMAAKKNYYNGFDLIGIKEYRKWLELEPDNLEALFDLAQIYSRNMQWGKAGELYDRVLKIYPYHPWAKIALDKAKINSNSVSAETGFEHYDASSASRDIDEKYWDIYAKARAPISENVYLSVREDTILYQPSAAKSFQSQKTGVAIEYDKLPMLSARAAYVFSAYTGQPKDSSNFNGEVNFKPSDMGLLTFLYKREDVEDNSRTLIRNLKRDDYKIRASIMPNRRLTFGSDYTYSRYTDNNEKFTYGGDIRSQILFEPHSLSVTYRYEEYGYNKSRNYYFTPGSFHYNTMTVEWREFLNKILFWGNNETYFSLKYAVNLDVHDQVGHLFYADLHRDWNNRFSTHLEWSKKIYDHRDIYGEELVLAYGKLYF